MKKIMSVIIVSVMFMSVTAFAGQVEDLKVTYLQEHIKNLQMEFQLTQNELQKAVADKNEADAKAIKENEKNKETEKK